MKTDIFLNGFVESDEPITLRDYKQYWNNFSGFIPDEEFGIYDSNSREKLVDDNLLLSGDLKTQKFELNYSPHIVNILKYRTLKDLQTH